MRKRIYEIIEKSEGQDIASSIYDYSMIIIVVISLIPLAFKTETPLFHAIDRITVIIFIIDYLLRWITADYKFNDRSVRSFVKYPLSAMAIVDLISILPSLRIISRSFKVLRVLRMIRAMRVLRVFKTVRYSRNFQLIGNVLKTSKDSLLAVGALAVGYIFISALVIYNVEPNSFNTFFEAIYWACVSLTTVGYGDIYPTSMIGRIVTMISSFFGIAIVALPAGIITAGFMEELEKIKRK